MIMIVSTIKWSTCRQTTFSSVLLYRRRNSSINTPDNRPRMALQPRLWSIGTILLSRFFSFLILDPPRFFHFFRYFHLLRHYQVGGRTGFQKIILYLLLKLPLVLSVDSYTWILQRILILPKQRRWMKQKRNSSSRIACRNFSFNFYSWIELKQSIIRWMKRCLRQGYLRVS